MGASWAKRPPLTPDLEPDTRRIVRCPGRCVARPYHRPVLSPVLLALAFGLVAVATVPTRRLHVAGWGPRPLLAYLATLVLMESAVVLGIGPLKVTVPILVALVAAPYVLAGLGSRIAAARWPAEWPRPRSGRRPPPRVVGSGPGRTVPPDERSGGPSGDGASGSRRTP